MIEEKNFLHDISSPLTTVLLTLGNTLSILEDKKPEDLDTCIKMLEKCVEQTKRASTMIAGRREELRNLESK